MMKKYKLDYLHFITQILISELSGLIEGHLFSQVYYRTSSIKRFGFEIGLTENEVKSMIYTWLLDSNGILDFDYYGWDI